MEKQKEILVQDLSISKEVERLLKYQVYKRDKISGEPLYFAPYFCLKSGQSNGISYLLKVLGKVHDSAGNILKDKDLLRFPGSNSSLIKKWVEGIECVEKKRKEFSYLFLAEPLLLNSSLKKDKKDNKVAGVGKQLPNKRISKNTCMSFTDFVRRFMKANKL